MSEQQPIEPELIEDQTLQDLDRLPPRKLADDLSQIIEDIIGGGE